MSRFSRRSSSSYYGEVSLEAAAHRLALIAARRIARNSQVADVVFDRCKGFSMSMLARSGLNHMAYVLALKRTFYLTSVMLEVTNHCNLKCRFCPLRATWTTLLIGQDSSRQRVKHRKSDFS